MKTLTIILIFLSFKLGGAGVDYAVVEARDVEVFRLNTAQYISEDVKDRVDELSILHPAFRNKVIMLLYEARREGIELMIVETYRTPARQDYLKARRRSMLDGGESKHQYGLAVDVVPVVNNRLIWHDKKLWAKIGKIGKKYDMKWGGDWRHFKDYPHFEEPCEVTEFAHLEIPDTVLIPV